MTETKKVQLSGEELELARNSVREALEHLQTVAHLTFDKLDVRRLPLGPGGIVGISIRLGSAKILFRDESGGCAGVWEDPPGICRPCTSRDEEL